MAGQSEEWDHQYTQGRWQFLNELKETARYGIISAWLTQTQSVDSVLDVGCGEAILYHHLKSSDLQNYHGVDVSDVALNRAKRAFENVHLTQSDLESFTPKHSELFSAIVFNEVLYFCEKPERQLERYASFLKPAGVIAISMYTPSRGTSGANKSVQRLWQETDNLECWQLLDDLELKSKVKNVSWKLRLVSPIRLTD